MLRHGLLLWIGYQMHGLQSPFKFTHSLRSVWTLSISNTSMCSKSASKIGNLHLEVTRRAHKNISNITLKTAEHVALFLLLEPYFWCRREFSVCEIFHLSFSVHHLYTLALKTSYVILNKVSIHSTAHVIQNINKHGLDLQNSHLKPLLYNLCYLKHTTSCLQIVYKFHGPPPLRNMMSGFRNTFFSQCI
jgi:hypothetical protein